MPISDKLTYLNETKGKLKDSINKFRNGITNQTTFRNYATELDGIYDLLPKVQKTTSSDTLLNAQNGLVDEFKMYGNTIQETTTGKNLLSIDSSYDYTQNGISGSYNDRTGDFTISGKASSTSCQITRTIPLVLDAGTYTFSINTTLNSSIYLHCYYSDSSYYNIQIQAGETSITVTTTKQITSYNIRFLTTVNTTYNETVKLQLESGSNATNWEKYTNGVSPNPYYPQDVRVVTGEQTINIIGKNLLKGIEEGDISDTTGEDVISTEYWRSIDFVKIPSGTGIYFSLNGQSYAIEKSLRLYNKNKQYIGYTSNAGTYPFYTSNTPVTKVTSVIDDTPAYLKFVTSKASFESANDETMLFQTTIIGGQPFIDPTYEPYQENNYTINLSSKNLIPTSVSDWEQGTISSADGTNSSSTKRIRTKEYYPINNDTNYYISINGTNGKFLNIHFYDVNYKYLGNYYSIDGSISGATNKLINVSSASLPNIAYMRPVLISKTSNDDISPSDIVDIKPMIELGTTTTDFVEYYNYDLRKTNIYEDEIAKSTGKNLIGLGTQLNGYRATANGNFMETPAAIGYYFETSKLPDTITISSANGNRANVIYSNVIPYQGLSIPAYSYSDDNPRTITVDKTYSYVHIQFSYNIGDIYNIQIEEGSTATDYEPYGKGWYKKTKIGKVILNGSEEWSIANNVFYANVFTNRLAILGQTIPTYSNNYIFFGNVANTAGLTTNYNYATQNNLVQRILIRDERYTTTTDYSTWLSTHNTIVYYVLETPTTTEITQTELINQLEAISVFTGTNYFTISNLNNVLPSLNVKRLKELDKLS